MVGRIPFSKPHLDVPGQLRVLRQRGMAITDDAKAAACLERIGYYRLSGYWYPFRKTEPAVDVRGRKVIRALDEFRPGTEFSHALALYVFDKRLRMLMLDAIERVEVGVRVSVGQRLGARDPWAHRKATQLHTDFTKRDPRKGRSDHEEWLERQDKLASRAREDFVRHFRERYNSELPIWMAIELWDFGLLSKFVSGMNHADQQAIATKYGLPRRELLTTWLRAINHVRNICAHHGRLWNRTLDDQPKLPRRGEIPLLDHIASDQSSLGSYAPNRRLYAVAAVIQHFLRTINPTTSWAQRLKDHLADFPIAPGVSITQMGFPDHWDALPLWNGA